MGDDSIDMVILDIDMRYFVTLLRAEAITTMAYRRRAMRLTHAFNSTDGSFNMQCMKRRALRYIGSTSTAFIQTRSLAPV